jgi:chloramphenicol-sensitive protein RarD
MEVTLLLMAAGAVTATPLLFFASATRRLSLSVVGFMMYVNPTLQFFVALYVLGEPFNHDQFIGFCFIWCALLVFSAGSLQRDDQHIETN